MSNDRNPTPLTILRRAGWASIIGAGLTWLAIVACAYAVAIVAGLAG